ncbi:hypothetical protein FHV95_1295 [Streptomyces coelicolor]|nr:hypothetical protein FHV92_1315 [Streptomyces coelicolor]TYP22383.1 hypothetical protein FHV94_1295 [Streptomyces coelicolor]TYP41570.1 hypothetical protein FHV95_1295 [Streptomyces coelicolor]
MPEFANDPTTATSSVTVTIQTTSCPVPGG